VSVACAAGELATGGGYTLSDVGGATAQVLSSSRGSGESWTIIVSNASITGTQKLTPYVECLHLS
jgi:hypothetical protein